MTGPTSTPSLIQRQPVAAAAGITATVALVLGALWAVLHDAGALLWLQPSTQDLINAAVIAVVSLLAGWWAQRHSTSLAAPKIAEGTTVVTTNATTGATTGTTTV